MYQYKLGDKITIAGQYRRRSLWQWLTRSPKECIVYTVTESSLNPGGVIRGY